MHTLIENCHVVQAFPPAAAPASTEDYVSLKNWDHVTVLISVDNGSTVTGTTVTLKQATAVAGTSEQALAFTSVYANTDTGASDTLVATAVTSSTFDTDTTNAKNLLYVIEVPTASLDIVDGFDCFRVDVTGTANAVVAGLYVLSRGRYTVGGTPVNSAITD